MRFLYTLIGICLTAIAMAALCPFLILENVQAISYQGQAEGSDWREPITSSHFQINFAPPDDEVVVEQGTAKFYVPPAVAPVIVPAVAPKTVVAPIVAPVLAAPAAVLAPTVKTTAPAVATTPIVQARAPVTINGIPQRYAAPAPAVIPILAPTVTAKKTITAPPSLNPFAKHERKTIPINRVSVPTPAAIPVTSFKKKPATRALQVPQGLFGKALPILVPPLRQSAVPRAQLMAERLDRRLRARSVAFGASLLTDGNGDVDPVRSGLLALSLFLFVLLIHTRRRLRAAHTPYRTKRCVACGPFTSRCIRP